MTKRARNAPGGDKGAVEQASTVGKARTTEAFIRMVCERQPNTLAERRIRVVAKTPLSPAAKVVFGNVEAIRAANVTVQAVFTSPRAKGLIREAVSKYAEVFGEEETLASFRVATFKSAEKLPEQVSLGGRMGWAGDSCHVRGDEVECGPLSPNTARAAALSFDLLWDVSSGPLPYFPKNSRHK